MGATYLNGSEANGCQNSKDTRNICLIRKNLQQTMPRGVGLVMKVDGACLSSEILQIIVRPNVGSCGPNMFNGFTIQRLAHASANIGPMLATCKGALTKV